MSSKSSTDPRVRRSRRWLQDALKALVQERPYESISVQEIAARADVNRTTFYQHFQDKDELLESIISDLLNKLFLDSERYMREGHPLPAVEAPAFVFQLFDEVGKEAGFFRRMLGQAGSPKFIRRMVEAIEADFVQSASQPQYGDFFSLRPGSPPPALVARFLALGVVGALSWWLEADEPHSARQAADWSWHFILRLGDWDLLARPT